MMRDCATVSAAEASAVLGVGRARLYDLLRTGRIPAFRIGSKPKYRIPLRVLERLLDDPKTFEREAEK